MQFPEWLHKQAIDIKKYFNLVKDMVSDIAPDFMMAITKDMPMKQIDIDGRGYLQRYYAGTLSDGTDIWFHRFLTSDSERHLHSHPFEFKTIMLCGAYTEEYAKENGSNDFRVTLPVLDDGSAEFKLQMITRCKDFSSIDSSYSRYFRYSNLGRNIGVFDWHRIVVVEPETWTMMIVKPARLPYWFFRDDAGNIEQVKASPKDWWSEHKPRD